MPLIGSVARIYAHAPRRRSRELMQEGVVGLLRALERYDPDLGTPFWAYASWWVRQAMQQVVSELSPASRALRPRAAPARRTCARPGAALRALSVANPVQELAAASELTLTSCTGSAWPSARRGACRSRSTTRQGRRRDLRRHAGAILAAEEAYRGAGMRDGAAELPRLLEQLSDRERVSRSRTIWPATGRS